MNLYIWAARWNLPNEAIWDLMQEMGRSTMVGPTSADGAVSEDGASSRLRLAYANAGHVLWRNNVGAMQDPKTGRVIRFGLANESAKMNEQTKSSDLIGITKVLITPEMVGRVIGQFTAREMKIPGWVFNNTPREIAQLNYLNICASMGADAAFSTGC